MNAYPTQLVDMYIPNVTIYFPYISNLILNLIFILSLFLIGYGNLAFGEVVFNTSMTGYQEILTDPSYKGQIVVQTYPLIGNYGINDETNESDEIQVSGYVVRKNENFPSHISSKRTLDQFLKHCAAPIGFQGQGYQLLLTSVSLFV